MLPKLMQYFNVKKKIHCPHNHILATQCTILIPAD